MAFDLFPVASAATVAPAALWLLLTRLGEAQLLLPVALLALAGLSLNPAQRPVAKRWVVGFAAAFGATMLSKIAFMGWGVGSARLDFTGFSGHAMHAAAVLPLLAWLGLQSVRSTALRAGGVFAMLALAALVAYSRLPVGAHSASESLTGFLLGACVSLWALQPGWSVRPATPMGAVRQASTNQQPARLLNRSAVLAVVMLGLLGAAPWVSPPTRTHQWVTALSLKLSGRPAPYTRHHLHLRSADPLALMPKASTAIRAR